jgi:hypothetical protein
MQPIPALERPGRMPRNRHVSLAAVAVAFALALALSTLPMRQAAACMCFGLPTPEEVVATNDVTFIGSVVDSTGNAAIDPGSVRYAFDVERASAPTDAVVVVDAGANTSCGTTFGMGERWVVAGNRANGELRTTMCSGNRLVDDLPAAELATFTELLPNVRLDPPEPASGGSQLDGSPAVAIGVALAGTLALVAVVFVAVGRRGTRPDG